MQRVIPFFVLVNIECVAVQPAQLNCLVQPSEAVGETQIIRRRHVGCIAERDDGGRIEITKRFCCRFRRV
eukprot:902217-Rhodomonas_salina.3